MKTLANCSPKEFFVQTNKIRKSVSNWLTLTGIMEIRKTMPDIPKDASTEERKEAVRAQTKANLTRMADAIFEKYPEESAELLGLLCFIEPDDLENHSMKEILASFADIIGCKEVLDFFTSLESAGLIDIFNTAKQ